MSAEELLQIAQNEFAKAYAKLITIARKEIDEPDDDKLATACEEYLEKYNNYYNTRETLRSVKN